MIRLLYPFIFICFSLTAISQNTTNGKLKVYLDCKNVYCDYNFIRSEIKLVDFVLDRLAADVHLLITSVRTGNGGRSVQYIFDANDSLAKYTDTLSGNLSPNLTAVEIRSEIAKKIKQGLVPFLFNSSYGDLITIGMKPKKWAENAQITENTTDKWNYWIFNVGSDGNFRKDQVYKETNLNGHFSANRTTDQLKVNFSSYWGYENNSYTTKDTSEQSGFKKTTVVNSHYSINHSLIKSISKHWSAGYEAHISNSTFSNNKRRLIMRAAVEYAIFPYSEVNNKFFTINYGIDVRKNTYYDTTIYNKIEEILWGHRLQAYLSLKQKWGSVNSTITYSNYFQDKSLNNLSLGLNVNVRITGGLSFYVYSSGGLVHDQVYLLKGKTSEKDILVKRRQIASSYNFRSGVGLNFRFGSILNNFVNPRFDHP